jgi:hypothetical protein
MDRRRCRISLVKTITSFPTSCSLWRLSQMSFLPSHRSTDQAPWGTLGTTPLRRIGGMEVQLHTFLTSVLNGVQWSASYPRHFTPRERAPSTQWIGDCVSPRASMDMVVTRTISSPYWDLNPNHSACTLNHTNLYLHSESHHHLANKYLCTCAIHLGTSS